MDWFAATLLATLTFGVFQALQRIAAARALPAPTLIAASATTVALLAAAGTTLTGEWARLGEVAHLSLSNAALFTTGTLALLEALRRATAATILPVAKLDGLLAVLIGIVGFGERPNAVQALGIVCGLGVVVALSWRRRRSDRPAPVGALLLAGGAACCFASSMSIGKLAAATEGELPFMALSYSATAAIALAVRTRTEARNAAVELHRRAWLAGAAMGVLNFVGYRVLLHAFATGPMVLIQPVFSSSMLIAVLLAARVLSERIAGREALALGLSLLAALLVRLG